MQKPHIGTDILIEVVRKMREEILRLGGEFSFHSQVTDLLVEQHCLQVNGTEEIPAGVAVFAIGHSARDTFEMLNRHQLPMRAKSFAVGGQGGTSAGTDRSVAVRKKPGEKNSRQPHIS